MAFNRDVGIFMRDSNSNLFDNVVIEDSGNHGIFVAQVDDISTCPIDNEFHNLTVVRSQGAGFRLNNACVQNRLTGTAIFRQNRYFLEKLRPVVVANKGILVTELKYSEPR